MAEVYNSNFPHWYNNTNGIHSSMLSISGGVLTILGNVSYPRIFKMGDVLYEENKVPISFWSQIQAATSTNPSVPITANKTYHLRFRSSGPWKGLGYHAEPGNNTFYCIDTALFGEDERLRRYDSKENDMLIAKFTTNGTGGIGVVTPLANCSSFNQILDLDATHTSPGGQDNKELYEHTFNYARYMKMTSKDIVSGASNGDDADQYVVHDWSDRYKFDFKFHIDMFGQQGHTAPEINNWTVRRFHFTDDLYYEV